MCVDKNSELLQIICVHKTRHPHKYGHLFYTPLLVVRLFRETVLFQERSQSHEKRLVPHSISRLSVCISSAPTGRIYVKFDIADFLENLSIK